MNNEMSWRVLDFIQRSWNGRTFSEIQQYIVEDIHDYDWDLMVPSWKWNEKESKTEPCLKRKWRGYWCDRLLGGMHTHQGLLWTYCIKRPDGRWIVTEKCYLSTISVRNNKTLTLAYNDFVREAVHNKKYGKVIFPTY